MSLNKLNDSLVNHDIKLDLGYKTPSKSPFLMVSPKIVESRKQLKELLDVKHIFPLKSLMVHWIVPKEEYGSL